MDPSSQLTYLNTAACGLIEEQALAAGSLFYARLAEYGSSSSENWRVNDEPGIRSTVATFIGATPGNLAMVPNFSWALNGLVQSLNGTERLLLYTQEFPSLLDPFKINHFPIRWIEDIDGFYLPVDEIKQCIRSREVDIVALSHVQFNSGYKLAIDEIGALCHEYGVWFIVDATQSIGAISIDVLAAHIDVLIASNYKWMNAGFGTGILYISDSFLTHYSPVVGGFNSYKDINNSRVYIPSVQSYEPGHPNMYGLNILEAAINHKQAYGVDRIEKHNNELTALLLSSLKGLPVQLIGPFATEDRCSIVLLRDINDLSAWLRAYNIITTNRNGIIRISMHYYNSTHDVDRLVQRLSEFRNK